jgi:hypothetical protein
MRGKIISEEFNHMVWVSDKEGKQYACRIEDIKNVKRKEDLTEEEQQNCLDLSQVVGDSW